MKTIPVYTIRDFRNFSSEDVFYANTLRRHIQFHDFTNTPHKHDFYLLVLFTSGKGTHEVDFTRYEVKPGALFVMRPGQMHSWNLSKDSDGFVFFHTREFYDSIFASGSVKDYSFYSSLNSSALVRPGNAVFNTLKDLMSGIVNEYYKNEALKFQKLHALVNLVYIELARIHTIRAVTAKENYLDKLKQFEELVDTHFRDMKYPRDYAGKMHISEKHLNRISTTCLGKTSTDLIAERVILEAKRMLLQSKLSVSQVGNELGYQDKSYFTRFFKKRTGETPVEFLHKYKL